MFSPEIVCSEEFLSMPVSCRDLYMQLGMRADDDGFIQPKLVMRTIGSDEDDLSILLAKRFLLAFDNGVVVIKHWLIHNLIRADRYKPTRFQEQKKMLYIKENNAYTDHGCQNDNQMAPQVRLGKVRLGKLSAKPKTFSNFRNQRRLEAGRPPMLVKKTTGRQKEVWGELSEIDYEFKRYREKAESKTGEDYSLLDDGVNPQTRRLMGLTISKTRAKGKTMDDFYEYIFEKSEYARKNKYNPLVCLTDRMMMDWQLEGIKVKDTIEDVARRLLDSARKRGNGDTDESDYRMWARTGMAKELGMTDNDFFDSEEYKKVKHIIGD